MSHWSDRNRRWGGRAGRAAPGGVSRWGRAPATAGGTPDPPAARPPTSGTPDSPVARAAPIAEEPVVRGARIAVPLVVAVLLGAAGLALGADRPGPVPVAALGAVARPAPPPSPIWVIPAPVATPAPARPTRLRIPAIGVDSRIVDIGVDAAGVLVPPATTDVTGWFTASRVPGGLGPALLAGHVDSRAGPGVFWRLAELRPGAEVTVDRADGSAVTFVVVSSLRVAKTAFPTDLVYAPQPVPMVRLVTCGGTFDHTARSYRDNIIVEAVLS